MDDGGAVRIGDRERQAAVEALTAHREAGRLAPTEFEERQVIASRARTWAEIVPLFADLPDPRPAGMPVGLPAVVVPMPGPGAGGRVAGARRSPLDDLVPTRHRDTVMALTPFLAVVLFFATKSWLWFLAIPIMGILLYGADGKPKRHR
jgi:hypothetical protein